MSEPTPVREVSVSEAPRKRSGPLRKPGWSQRPGGKPYIHHSVTAAKRALERGLALDRRTRLGKAMLALERELTEDLGELSPRQAQLVKVAVRLRVIADSATVWLFAQRSMVNGRKKALYPVADQLAGLLTRYAAVLKDLGLERKVRTLNVAEQFAQLHEADAAAPAGDAQRPRDDVEIVSSSPDAPGGQDGGEP